MPSMTSRSGSPAACASMVLMRWITPRQFNLSAVRAFYSDHFVLPLPEGHKFPMAKYSGLRERILAEGIVGPQDLHEAPARFVG